MPNSNRYSRQILLSQIGLSGQEKILKAKVLVVGMGGLGCQVGIQLAGAGVGKLSIVDHDTIDISNLHRQVLFRESDIGLPKALVAQRQLIALNSQIEVTAQQTRVSVDNVNALLNDVDLVIDAADSFACSYLLSDACLRKHTPLLSASVNRSFGYVGIFCGTIEHPAPSVRALFPKLPKEQLSCDTVGVTGPGVGVMASLQAQEALKVLLDDPQQLLAKLLYVDLWQYKLHSIDFSNAQEPKNSQVVLIGDTQVLPTDTVIDVRNADEIVAARRTFSARSPMSLLDIPLPELSARISEIPKGERIVCACVSGQRALIAAQQLLDLGHSQVAVLLPD